MQAFQLNNSAQRVPLLGAVGPLQFEVVQYRMQTEYGAESRLESAPWKIVRWSEMAGGGELDDSQLPTGARLALDATGQTVILFPDQWSCDFFAQRNQNVRLAASPAQGELSGE